MMLWRRSSGRGHPAPARGCYGIRTKDLTLGMGDPVTGRGHPAPENGCTIVRQTDERSA